MSDRDQPADDGSDLLSGTGASDGAHRRFGGVAGGKAFLNAAIVALSSEPRRSGLFSANPCREKMNQC